MAVFGSNDNRLTLREPLFSSLVFDKHPSDDRSMLPGVLLVSRPLSFDSYTKDL